MMSKFCTSFHFLTFRPDVSFDNPKSTDGKLWNSVLKSITRTEGWNSLRWGKRLNCEDEKADLFIYWKSHESLAYFLHNDYPAFLSTIDKLLLHHPPPSPYACELHPFSYSQNHDALSSVYKLIFDSGLDHEIKLGLGIAEQAHRIGYRDIAADLNPSDLCPGADIVGLFQEMNMVWLIPCPSPTPPDCDFEQLFAEASQLGSGPKILLLITSWIDQDAERDIIRKYLETYPGYEGLKDPLAKDILCKATRFTKHQVVLEEVTEDNIEFLDKDEKWKTWMTRMIEEEHAKERAPLGESEMAQN